MQAGKANMQMTDIPGQTRIMDLMMHIGTGRQCESLDRYQKHMSQLAIS